MLKPLAGSDETLVHECQEGRGRPPVYLHDIYSYMLVDGMHVPVKYCPYCGTFIEDDNEAA